MKDGINRAVKQHLLSNILSDVGMLADDCTMVSIIYDSLDTEAIYVQRQQAWAGKLKVAFMPYKHQAMTFNGDTITETSTINIYYMLDKWSDNLPTVKELKKVAGRMGMDWGSNNIFRDIGEEREFGNGMVAGKDKMVKFCLFFEVK
eukprot:g45076.t1